MHEHREDVESDFSAIHRITDPASLTPQRFIDFAVRLGAYQGAVAARLRTEDPDDGPPMTGSGDRVVESTTVNLTSDPVLAGFLEVGTGG